MSEGEKNGITLEAVSLFGGDIKILDSISMTFPLHQCTVVMGFSGSGRSTLLKVAAGILWPNEGVVRVNNKPLSRMNEKELLEFRSQCGFAFQDAALWSNLTVYQNLLLPLQFHRRNIPIEQLDRKIHRILAEFDFQDDPQFRPAQLSAGERKLISLLRALVLEPSILFLDEPTSFLDNVTVERILRTLKTQKQEGKTLIIATHSPELTSQLADRLVILKGGKIVEQGLFREVVRSKNPDVIEVISEVLSEAAVYDTDILELLQDSNTE
ncbi:MAG: ATP-binding cassette domain-containing protein [Spirochaetes bacterium]|nr:ATP-binding cassette domain-containing protein [Spirochaetota bacterium]